MTTTLAKRLLLASAAIGLAAAPALSAGAPAGARASRPAARAAVATRVGQTPAGTQRPTAEKLLSIGQGELITLPTAVTDVWVSNPGVADVYVSNPRQIHLFGKEFGEATLFATTANGTVVYATNIRVSQNITSVDRMLRLAMPDANIKVVTAGQIAVLTGTVASPEDAGEALRLVTAMLNPGVDPASTTGLKIAVVSRLKTATPLQVNLQVRIAEVSRSFVKNLGVNTTTRDATSGFTFGLAQGRSPGAISQADLSTYPIARIPIPGGGTIEGAYDVSTGTFINPRSTGANDVVRGATRSTIGLAGRLLGLDILSAIDLGETIGQVSTLANPNLTSLSGETATFLAGGEIPIPVSQGLGAVSVEFKSYGVSLAYTPTVLSNGRISLRVRPEVSQLTNDGAVQINGTTIPAFTTRRAETTLELGSGQSMVIGGLLSNNHNNSIDQTPGLGNLPVLGALFRSNGFRRSETELVIVVTPYLVRPVDNPGDIVLPTDGARAPTDLGRYLLGELGSGQSGARRPVPTMVAPSAPPPTIGAVSPVVPRPVPQASAAQAVVEQRSAPARRRQVADERATRRDPAPMPGFSN
jgi:pilus assembly protein CpaC